MALVISAVTVTVGCATWIASVKTRRSFESQEEERTAALVAQFRQEFRRRGEEVVKRVTAITQADFTLRMAIDLRRAEPDYSSYVGDAAGLAQTHGLDFLELIASDGTIVSSAQWPARFGYREEWVIQVDDWNDRGFFLKSEDLPDSVELALIAVRSVSAGDKKLYIVGGYRLGREFLASIVMPAGMRVLLYRNFTPQFTPQSLIAAGESITAAEQLGHLIETVRATGRESAHTVSWSDGPETIQAITLMGRERNLLGVLLVGNSRRDLMKLLNDLRTIGIAAAGIGILLGLASSYWISIRVTRPVETLARGARRVADGDWKVQVDVPSNDEIGELAEAFNAMTRQLIEQRDRLIQAERVAAWRELARRLAHELKNPLFPLQITIENLQRAKAQAPEQFDEVFRESSATLLGQLSKLKTIIGRFSEFARMPPLEMEIVDLNALVRDAVRLFEPQFQGSGRAPIETELVLDPELPPIKADPEQLTRVMQNLLLNAVDAMPRGGRVTIRTLRKGGATCLELSDTGEGLTQEECERLFTPYYTTKQHGTGLGLAIVQSVVSDHGAKISVDSEPGRGTSFRIVFAPSAGKSKESDGTIP
jgi:signal transduction histidine kinase